VVGTGESTHGGIYGRGRDWWDGVTGNLPTWGRPKPLVDGEGNRKSYVQHRIRSEVRDEVWGFLKDDTCHYYYVCGDSNMAEDVYDELFLTSKTVGKLSHKDSWSVFNKMNRIIVSRLTRGE
jgi:hypothetical protein